MVRKICFVTGTRADFGLMLHTLQLLNARSDIELSIVITGMHTAPRYAETLLEVKAAGFKIAAEIPSGLDENSGASMAQAIGHEIITMSELWQQQQPDLVLLLGDRGEPLAAAIAAIHLNIHVAHVHGGERSGTVDEMVRHAVSKFSHYHFVATSNSRERLIAMGERPDDIYVTGAPGLDEISAADLQTKANLFAENGFDMQQPTVLLVFHPVVQEQANLSQQINQVLTACLDTGCQVMAILANTDAGGDTINQQLAKHAKNSKLCIVPHLQRNKYLSWMNVVDVMVGNSSSAIIEAASFNLPVVNVGSRQHLREQSSNTIDVPAEMKIIYTAIKQALQSETRKYKNVYGDGTASARIAEYCATLPLDSQLLQKTNAY
jgi:GDP/UDP-N,N'-diacetylbacillosamine 2-epimerase (hydrolysing)